MTFLKCLLPSCVPAAFLDFNDIWDCYWWDICNIRYIYGLYMNEIFPIISLLWFRNGLSKVQRGCNDIKIVYISNRDSSRLLNSVVVETETHRDWEFLWLLRPRLIETGKFCGCRDRDSSRLGNSVVSRPRLIETGKFCGCRDRDSSRLGISVVVETETSRDWTKVVETETSSRVSLISDMKQTKIVRKVG